MGVGPRMVVVWLPVAARADNDVDVMTASSLRTDGATERDLERLVAERW
jgi:hypothetical protein